MVTIVRDHVADLMKSGKTLDQIKAAAPARGAPAATVRIPVRGPRTISSRPSIEAWRRKSHEASVIGPRLIASLILASIVCAVPRANAQAQVPPRQSGPRGRRLPSTSRAIGRVRHGRLAVPDDHAPKGDYTRVPLTPEGARSPTPGIRRPTRRRATSARRSAPPRSCACRGAFTSPGRTTTRCISTATPVQTRA